MCERGRWGATRSSFVEQRAALFDDHSRQGTGFARAYAGLVDGWLTELLGEVDDVALVAVGGYGRGELAPGSDIDVVLVHRGQDDIGEIANAVWYPIWDLGVRLDHSVKTVDEALAVAGRDLKAALGLVTARTVAGDRRLGDDLAARAMEQWTRHGRRWLPVLDQSIKQRHARMGDLAYLLEPELKECRGGLRDITALRAAALAAPVVPDSDLAMLDSSDILVSVRVALHRLIGKGSDRLHLQDQEQVANALGIADVEDLMRSLAAAARTVGWASDDAWRRIDAWLAGGSRRRTRPDRRLSPGVVLDGAEVALSESADLADESLVLRVAASAAAADAAIARQTLERLRGEAAIPGDPWSANARLALVDLLGAGRGCIAAFEALDQYDLLTRILPEWGPVRSKPQHNPYHRFTVDRHLIEAAVQAAGLIERVARPDLLLVAAWLHDLGKGYPGDHTDAGVELVATIAPRLGFSTRDQQLLISLTRHHLLLADEATRRDVRDPATVARVVEAVGDLETLELLHALTEADAAATGPTAWTTWRRDLVDELVVAVGESLRGNGTSTREWALEPRLQVLVAQAEGGLLVWADQSRLIVVAPDRPGLFCQLTGVLAVHGLDVLAADVWSAPGVGEGTAVDEFILDSQVGNPDWARVQQDVSLALRGELALEARLADRVTTYFRRQPRALRAIETTVLVDNDASADATVIEVRGPNTIGALYRVARALTACHLDIRHAKVLTLGSEIVDSFYVVDESGAKLDAGRSDEMRRAVLADLTALIT